MMKKPISVPVRIAAVILITAVVSVCGALLYRFLYIKGVGLKCIFFELTGFYCPGCGMGRASLCLLRGDFFEALKNNPFIFLLILIGIYIFARLIDWAATGKNHIDKYIPPRLLMAIFIILAVYGVLRNIPFYPFTMLTPH